MDRADFGEKAAPGAERDFLKPPFSIALILFLGLLAYSNTFGVPFVFDDAPNITRNPLVRDISNIPRFFVGGEGPFASRPLMHATLALNFYLGGLDTAGYHALNLSLHLANALLLYLLVTLTGRRMGYAGSDAGAAGFFSALLFSVHPLQTEAVTYVVSRSMLLATLFYLAGLLLFLKAATSNKRKPLYIAGLFAVSLLGMASREDFATFPLMLVIYDLFFVSRFDLRRAAGHWKAYLPAFLSLAYLAFVVSGHTYDSAGSSPGEGISPTRYVLTQFRVHFTYLRLLLLPVGQSIDPDYPVAEGLLEPRTALTALGYLALWAAGLALSRRRPLASFSLLWFLITFVPASFAVAFMGLRLDDVLLEHRLYLPSVGLFVAAGAAAALARGRSARGRSAVRASVLLLALVLAATTYARNSVWQSGIGLWEDAVRKAPEKARPHNNLGLAYSQAGLPDKAMEHFKRAVELKPGYSDALLNIGAVFVSQGDFDRAIGHYLTALRFHPGDGRLHYNLARAYHNKGMAAEAMREYEASIELRTRFKEDYIDLAYKNMGSIALSEGHVEEAIGYFGQAVSINPGNAAARSGLGSAYLLAGRLDAAEAEYRKLLRIDPGNADAYINLGIIFKRRGMLDEAIAHYERALELNRNSASAHYNLGNAYMLKGLTDRAIGHYEDSLALDPADADVHLNLARAYRMKGLGEKAAEHARIAREIKEGVR